MVTEAKTKQASAEMQLKEANMKVFIIFRFLHFLQNTMYYNTNFAITPCPLGICYRAYECVIKWWK